jgi:hypothetical protein
LLFFYSVYHAFCFPLSPPSSFNPVLPFLSSVF